MRSSNDRLGVLRREGAMQLRGVLVSPLKGDFDMIP